MADLVQDPLSARKAFDALPTSLSPATPENIANLVKLKQAQIEAQTVLQNTQPGMMMVNPAFEDAQKKAQQAQDAFDAAYNGLGKDGQLAVTNYIAANAATEARFQKDLSEMPGVGDIAPGITEQSAPSLFELAKLKDGISQADQAIIEMNMTAQMAGQITDPAAYTAALQAKEAAESKFRDTYNTMAANGQLADIQNYLDSNRLTFIQRVGRNAGLVADGFTDFTKETAAGLVSLPGLAADGANWLTGHRLYDGSAGTASHDWAMGGINWLNTHDLFGNEVSGEFVENKTANEQTATNNISTAFTVASVVVSIPSAVRGGASLLAKGGTMLEAATPALTTTAKVAEVAPAAEIAIPTATATSKAAPVIATVDDALTASLADAAKARAAATPAFKAAATAEEMPAAASTVNMSADAVNTATSTFKAFKNWVSAFNTGARNDLNGALNMLYRDVAKAGDNAASAQARAELLLARARARGFTQAEVDGLTNSKIVPDAVSDAVAAQRAARMQGIMGTLRMPGLSAERFKALASYATNHTTDFLRTSSLGTTSQVARTAMDSVFGYVTAPFNLARGAFNISNAGWKAMSFQWVGKGGSEVVTAPLYKGFSQLARATRAGATVAADQYLLDGAIRHETAKVTGGVTNYAANGALNLTASGIDMAKDHTSGIPSMVLGYAADSTRALASTFTTSATPDTSAAALTADGKPVPKQTTPGTGVDFWSNLGQKAEEHPLMAAAAVLAGMNFFGDGSIVDKGAYLGGLMLLAWGLEMMLGPEFIGKLGNSLGAGASDLVNGNYSNILSDMSKSFSSASKYDSMIGTGRQLAAQQEADWNRQLKNPTPALVPAGP